jgi:hypothetical protein
MMNSIEHNTGEIVMYQPDETIKLEVRLEDETVWLTQAQIANLFQKAKSTISFHISNIFKEGELNEKVVVRKYRTTTHHGALEGKEQTHEVAYYNLDVIISVGYRVKSLRGTKFRQWATGIIREHLLRGYTLNQRMDLLESKMEKQIEIHGGAIQQIQKTLNDHQEKIDFFVRTNQPPVEGVLFEGQIFDAYKLVEALVKSAKQEIILIDNYIDATIFDLLEKREQDVDATIYTEHVGQSLQHLQQLNHQQYGRRIEVKEYNSRFHDRFLILDDSLYHFGASFKDLGKRLFAFELMGIDKNIILNQL